MDRLLLLVGPRCHMRNVEGRREGLIIGEEQRRQFRFDRVGIQGLLGGFRVVVVVVLVLVIVLAFEHDHLGPVRVISGAGIDEVVQLACGQIMIQQLLLSKESSLLLKVRLAILVIIIIGGVVRRLLERDGCLAADVVGVVRVLWVMVTWAAEASTFRLGRGRNRREGYNRGWHRRPIARVQYREFLFDGCPGLLDSSEAGR